MRNAHFLIGVTLSSCATINNGSGEKKAFVLSTPAQEAQMGKDAYREVLKKNHVSQNDRIKAMLKRVGNRIAVASGADFDWEFNLIENSEMNAFCLPGGKVAVYTGLLSVLKNEAGMAAVIGHEVAHAVLRHGAQRMATSVLAQGVLTAASLALSKKSENERNTWIGLMGAGASVGVLLPFSRGHESEADATGLRYAAMAGYDPSEAVRLWERFSAATRGSKPPAWLSTHPNDSDRIQNLDHLQSQVAPLYDKSPHYGIGELI